MFNSPSQNSLCKKDHYLPLDMILLSFHNQLTEYRVKDVQNQYSQSILSLNSQFIINRILARVRKTGVESESQVGAEKKKGGKRNWDLGRGIKIAGQKKTVTDMEKDWDSVRGRQKARQE